MGKHSCCRMQVVHQTHCRAHPWRSTSLQGWLPTALPTALLQRLQSSCARGQPWGRQQTPCPKGNPEKLQNVLSALSQRLALNTSDSNSQSTGDSSCATFPAASWQLTRSSPFLIITDPSSFSNNFPKPRTHQEQPTVWTTQCKAISCSFCSSGYL